MTNLFADLAHAFPTPPLEEWRTGVLKTLKGEPFDKRLVVATPEGLRIKPLYTRHDWAPGETPGALQPGAWPCSRGFAPFANESLHGMGAWAIASRIESGDLRTAGRLALADLEGGAHTVEIAPAEEFDARALHEALQGVHWSLAPVAVRVPGGVSAGVTHLRRTWEACAGARALASGEEAHRGLFLQSDVLADTLSAKVDAASASDSPFHSCFDALFDILVPLASGCARASDGTSVHPLDARPFLVSSEGLHCAGGNVAQEIALVLGSFVSLVRACEARGLRRDRVLRATEFRLAVSSDFFTEIAKFRALRACLGKVLASMGLDSASGEALVSAVTSGLTQTRYDAHTNLVRATEQTFAAIAGGARKIITLPYNRLLSPSSPEGLRLARNTQIILAEESGLGLVADPAGGSWYVESRTQEIAARAWELFSQWEAAGGAFALLEQGALQAEVETVWEARLKGLAKRREPVLGVSEFPLPGETPQSLERPLLGRSFPARTLGEPFERLRDAAARFAAQTGRTPLAYIALHGPGSALAARLTWVKSLLAAAGIDALAGEPEISSEQNAEAFRKSDAKAAILVSTDDLYDACIPELTSALKAAGAQTVWVAVNPGAKETDWRAVGVDAFAHVGCDAHALLSSLLALLVRLGGRP